MDFLAVLILVVQTLSTNYIRKIMACLCGGICFLPEYLSTTFITTSNVVMERQSVADLIKKLSNNVKTPFEMQAPKWSEEVSWLTELLLENTASVQCVCIGALLLLYAVVFYRICLLLPLCDVAWPNERAIPFLYHIEARWPVCVRLIHTERWGVKVATF